MSITAKSLNERYASISTDNSYKLPLLKSTVPLGEGQVEVTEEQVFEMLDCLRPTASGLDNLPSWFLRLAAPIFAAPIATLFSMSLASSYVPRQWKQAAIHPIPKIACPLSPVDFRPISITPILCRIIERIVVRDYIYPSFLRSATDINDDNNFNISDQFAFRPSGSTTAALVFLLQTISDMLATNKYVIVYAIDFSKAFDSVRHYTLLGKYADLRLPDFVFNWLNAFFCNHSHCTRFAGRVSDIQEITASIVQGSAVGPPSYVVLASDLHPVHPSNAIAKYADDTYLIIPASNHSTCQAEIKHIEEWATTNNLKLNRSKSHEMVFIKPKTSRQVFIPPPEVEGFSRVQQLTILGVTISYNLSVNEHIDRTLAGCARLLYGLKTLRAHGMMPQALNTVFQCTVLAKLTYATPAWWGFTSASDRNRLEAFLRRMKKFGYYPKQSPTFASLCDQADERFFFKVRYNNTHPLHSLLPPKVIKTYKTRPRGHPFQLPTKTNTLDECNFLCRMLYKCI